MNAGVAVKIVFRQILCPVRNNSPKNKEMKPVEIFITVNQGKGT